MTSHSRVAGVRRTRHPHLFETVQSARRRPTGRPGQGPDLRGLAPGNAPTHGERSPGATRAFRDPPGFHMMTRAISGASDARLARRQLLFCLRLIDSIACSAHRLAAVFPLAEDAPR